MRKLGWIVVVLAACSKPADQAPGATGGEAAKLDVARTAAMNADKAAASADGSDVGGADKAGAEKAGADKAGADRADADKAGADKAGADKAGADKERRRKHEDRREPVVADAPPLKLLVVVNGAAAMWDQAAFDKVAKYTKGSDGEARDVWSLRELVHGLEGASARVTSVTGLDGTKAIDGAAWSDGAKTPLMHTTRRGTLKFRWADANGKWGESEVRDVTKIEISR
jgi:hypothetical protein